MKTLLVMTIVLSASVASAQGIGLSGGAGAGGVGQALRDLEAQRQARIRGTMPEDPPPTAAALWGEHLLIFGGETHATFFGCLTCPAVDPDSLNNPYGTYGNKYSASSVFNKFSLLRNPYTSVSMCNPMAASPPIVVDGNGKFYGELTLNTARPSRAQAPYLQRWLLATCNAK